MKSVFLDRESERQGQNAVLKTDVPVPEPADGQVLIQVRACGLSPVRLDVIRELQLDTQCLPIGREVAGVVTKIGGGVTRCKVGDEVAGVLPVDSICSGCAEYCVASDHDIVIKPMRVSFHDAAAGIGDAVRAFTVLHYLARVCAGDTVLVINGARSSGTITIQLAQHWGAKVLATASSKEESIFLESFKPELAQVIETDQSKKYALIQQCIEETGGLGVDCIIDDGVSMFPKDEEDPALSPRKQKKLRTLPTKHEVISALGVGGRWVTSQTDLQIDPPDSQLLHMRCASVSYLNEAVWNLSCGQLGRYLHILQSAIDKLADGVLRPNIASCISLDEACQAYSKLPSQTIGKTVVEISHCP
ncbi:quinone oxidoreductase-like protein 1 [Acanthaster planci]|uniref:Quinone oxidoreductase-like protein 1 n=1 Tax=Acanthaster planci TaxID=133434 RepID=A0A8B7XNC2_ACAPL|nr:quinone oxidoreductase-like protein 1 [Acanthaster planci]